MKHAILSTVLTLAAALPALAQRDGREQQLADAARDLQTEAWSVRQRINLRHNDLLGSCTSVHHAAAHLQTALRNDRGDAAVQRQDRLLRRFFAECENGVRRDYYARDREFMRRFNQMERAYERYTVAYDRWDRGGRDDDGRFDAQIVRCSSNDERYKRCAVNGRIRSVDVERQLSETRCVEGRTWGWDANSIWVDNGCRADFRVTFRRDRDRDDRDDRDRRDRRRDRIDLE